MRTLIFAPIWCTVLASVAPSLAVAPASHPIVVTGATGRVGAAVVHSLVALRGSAENLYILSRNADKARELCADAQHFEADYADEDALRAALSAVPHGFRLFVACSNGPAQASLEGTVCRAAVEQGCGYVVKLSTSTPVLEMKEGGPYAAHLEVEQLLRELAVPHAVLRPNLFMDEVCVGAFLGVSGPLATADTCAHPFADASISVVDVRDVGACAAALLVAESPEERVGTFEITGGQATCLGTELAAAISELRPRRVAIDACTVDQYIASRNLPPPIAANK